jgi:tyrosine-protein kinase Etk/Wzc
MIEQGVYSSATRAPQKDASSWEAPGTGHEVSLFDVLTQLAYRKWLIAKVTAIAMLAGVTMCLVLPVRYTATTKIMPPQQTQSTASMMMNQLANLGAGSLAAVAGGGLGLKNPNDIYVGLLNSRPIADAVIHRFGLVRVYGAKDMTAARKRLAHDTVVVSEKTGFIAVSVTDKDKRRVAEMANAYTDELRILTKNLAMTEASQRRLFYEDQLKQAKEILVGAEMSFQQVQQRKGLVQLDAQARAMIESLALLRAQVTAREVEVQALRSYSTEHNPELELAEGELSSLRAEGARMEQRNHSSGFSDLGLGDVPGAGMEYLRAEHEVKYRQAMFDLLLKQYDAAKLDESKDAAIIQVVEPAIEPDRRSSLKPPLMILLFTLGGAFAGCLLALLLWWKENLQSDPRMAKQIDTLRSAFIGLRTTILKA